MGVDDFSNGKESFHAESSYYLRRYPHLLVSSDFLMAVDYATNQD